MELKTASKNFIDAGKELVKSIIHESETQYEKKIQPHIDNVVDTVHRAKVKREINTQKPYDVKQDTSKRKYHRGG
jgi:hypothetical protein